MNNGIEFDDYCPGNANGNKFSNRIKMLEGLLEATGDGTSAKVNSLRQAISRSKTDIADSLDSSLDLLRQVFQAEMTEEIRQVMDRHIRTTFSPALENLRRNGFDIKDTDLNELCVNILESAKEPFLRPEMAEIERSSRTVIPSESVVKSKKVYDESKSNVPNFDSRRLYESEGNESDTSMASFSNTSQFGGNDFNRPRLTKKRGRPRKTDVDTGRTGSPLMNGTQRVNFTEAFKWNPDRIQNDSRFVLGSKVNKLLGMGHRQHIFVKYPRIFRYVGDDHDKAWLFDRNISTRQSGKVFFMLLEDVIELAIIENALPSVRNELQRYSFIVPGLLVAKVKAYMVKPFESLKARIAPASPLHINPMISSPTPSIISTENALNNMILQQGQDQHMESMLNSMANSGMLSNMNGGANPNNINLTSSLINALNMQLQQNGQQQGLLNAIAQHQQNNHSNGTNSNYPFVNNN